MGIYSAAYAIGSIPHMISSLINFIMLVALSELYDKGEFERLKLAKIFIKIFFDNNTFYDW